MLKIHNTLTRKVEEFNPINPQEIGMYTCGPTVYDKMHIGNLRTFVFSDLLKRVLEYDGFKVNAVQNITDIDDKIIKKAKDQNKTIDEVSKDYTKYFLEDIKKLNIDLGQTPHATDYIKDMISFIQNLIEKKFAYIEKDGSVLDRKVANSVYFDISEFKDYGKLSGIEKKDLKTGTRVLSDEYSKDDVQDFALWKSVLEEEVGFDSPWGKGRPGWHIECSAMSQKLLGDQFDLHLGGVDLIFPHHENEIAQSEAATGKSPFVKYWVHGAHLFVDGQKMSKSLNNFYTLDQVVKKGFDPLALRYLYLQTHYRQEMNFTWDALQASQNALGRLREAFGSLDKPKIGCAELEQKFEDAINNDLNMSEALAVVWEVLKSDNPFSSKAESLLKFDKVLGLGLAQVKSSELKVTSEVPENVQKLVKEREELRKQKRFHLADEMRHKIKKLGYEVKDIEKGKSEVKKI